VLLDSSFEDGSAQLDTGSDGGPAATAPCASVSRGAAAAAGHFGGFFLAYTSRVLTSSLQLLYG